VTRSKDFRMTRSHPAVLGCLVLGLACLPASGAFAAPADPLQDIREQLQGQAERLADQERRLADQAKVIETLKAERDEMLEAIRGAGLPVSTANPRPTGAPTQLALLEQVPPQVTEGLPSGPVGEAPAAREPSREVAAAIPSNVGVLTPPGRLILDPSIEYGRTSNNRLIFRGVEIVSGIQVGVIEARDVARDTAVATVAARYGLTSRLEVEARVPYVYRHDRFSTVARADPEFDPDREEENHNIGDVEFGARYQLNAGRGGMPIFVANARVKPPTGLGPYDVEFDPFGVPLELATGSGFWAAEGGVTMLYPSDPAIIYGGLTYLHNFARDIDKDVAGVRVGRVEPGASIGAAVGFGLSLNPRFSVSLGYSHSYIFPTKTQIGTSMQETRTLQVGSMQMGWSFRLFERLTLNNSFEFGVTSDAPDLRVVLRAPYRF
jgi:hypothetical protein